MGSEMCIRDSLKGMLVIQLVTLRWRYGISVTKARLITLLIVALHWFHVNIVTRERRNTQDLIT